MKDIVTIFALFTGAGFVLLSAAGAVRMPDLFTRMQAISKASTLGVGSLALSAAVFFANPDAAVRAAAIVVFYYLTNPIAAHVIARAAYFVGGEIRWRGTVIDELEGRYDTRTHQLQGPASPES
jgi:multicomponent Na+:H+ antiporter subunit G